MYVIGENLCFSLNELEALFENGDSSFVTDLNQQVIRQVNIRKSETLLHSNVEHEKKSSILMLLLFDSPLHLIFLSFLSCS